MFKLSQLRCFVAVAQELHFARAAKQLHIAQPAVSSQIKALEEWLGVRLLKRDARSVTLTSAGALFLAEAKLTLLQAQRAEAVAVQAARGQRSRIAVGYGSSVPFTGVLPGLLRPFIAEHPDLEVVLTELDPGQQVEGLKDRTIDFAMFPSGSVQRLPGIRTSPMLREGYDVVMSSGHPLAARESISMAELATETFIAIGRSTDDTPAWPLSGICGRTGFVPRIVHIVGQITTAISLAASGAGIAIVPHSSSQLNMFGAVYLPLEGDDHSTLEFAYRTNEGSRAILNLVDEARRYAAAMADRMTKGALSYRWPEPSWQGLPDRPSIDTA
ncbi:MAG: LysR substrate-binding domain-containing protein [Aliidongia sp.]